MLSYEEARTIALKYLEERESKILPRGMKLKLDESGCFDAGYAWVFAYNSARYLETGNFSDSLAGNGPFLVRKDSGAIHKFRTGMSLGSQLREYEQQNGLTAGVELPDDLE